MIVRRAAALALAVVLLGAVAARADAPPPAAAEAERVVFSAITGSSVEQWSARADGTDLRQLSTDGGTKSQPVPAPDGVRVAWTWGVRGGAHGVEVGSVLGGPTRLIATEVTGLPPTWSPTGDRLAWGNDRTVQVASADGGPIRSVFTAPATAAVVRWSPVSEQLAVLSIDSVEDGLILYHLAVGRADGTGWRDITPAGLTQSDVVWDPAGGRFAVEAGGHHVVVVPADGGPVQSLPALGRPLSWSTGGRILYATSDGAGRSIRADGTDDRAEAHAGRWNPSGTRIAHSEQTSAGFDLYVDERKVSPAAWANFPAFVPTAFGSTTRAAGADRVSTAVEVSRRAFPSARTVVVARQDVYADALAAAPLGGPVLLIERDHVPPVVVDEIRRLGAGRAVVMGTTDAVGPGAEAELRTLGLTVERVGGADRFATAAAAAATLPAATHGWLVKGVDADPARGWEDAVAVSAVAAARHEPVLLTTAGALPASTAKALDGLDSVTIVGGTGAVGDAVAADAARHATVDRVAGADRWATAVALAQSPYAAALDGPTAWLASGATWPDAVTAGPAAAAGRSPLLLVDATDLARSAPTRSWLADTGRVRSAVLVGGAGAIGLAVARAVRQLLD